MVLDLRTEAPDGWAEAKCANWVFTNNEDPFFDEEDPLPAMDFCNGVADGKVCPIRHECLIFALRNNEKFGVWGGMSEVGRKAVRKKFPSYKGQENEHWQWMQEQEAVRGLSRSQLKQELEEDG